MQYQDELNHVPHVRESMKTSTNIMKTEIGWGKYSVQSGLGHHCFLPGTLQSLTLLSTARTSGALVTTGGKNRRATQAYPLISHQFSFTAAGDLALVLAIQASSSSGKLSR